MRHMMRTFVCLATVGLLLFGAAAMATAAGQQEPVEAEPYDPDQEYEISIGVFGDLEAAYSQVFDSPEFQEEFPNVDISFEAAEFGAHHERLTTVLAAGEATNDIEAVEVEYIAAFVEEGALTDLTQDPFNADEYVDDLVDFAVSNAMTRDGELIAVPVDIAPAVLFYRESLIEEAGYTAEDIETLQDWDEFIEVAQDVDALGDDIYGIPDAHYLWEIPLYGGKGGWFHPETGDPLEPRERFIETLELVRDAREAGIDARVEEWTEPWEEAHRAGGELEIAFQPNGAWFGGALRDWMATDTEDWRVAWLPGQEPASLGGSYLAIPEQVPAEKKGVAWEIVNYLTTSEHAQLTTFETIDAFPANTQLFDHPIMDEPEPYYGGQQARQIFRDVALAIPEQRVSEYDSLAVDIFDGAVERVLGGTPVDEAYERALDEIRATM